MRSLPNFKKIGKSGSTPSLLAVLTATSWVVPAQAENLESAIRTAVDYSPLLTSARSRVDGCAAEVTIARAEGLPTVDGTLRYSKELNQNYQSSDGLSASTSVNVPLFRGGAVRNGVKASEAQCDASNASIGEVEAEITLNLAQSYAATLANRRIVALNRDAVKNLTVMLEGIRQRLRAKDLTRTDVDQAESRLSLARGKLEAAQAALEASEVEYQRLTGKKPDRLAPFPMVFGIPMTADAAVEIAVSENPGIIAARNEAQSTRYSLNSTKGDLLPQVFATVNSNYNDPVQSSGSVNRSGFGTTVGIGMRMSLFAGGRQGAKVRAASARVTQAEQQVINLERSITARTQAAYAEWQASRILVETSRQAVTANESALNGVRLENAVGTRTILEILNAEQELRDAQIQLANAEKDHAVASIAILAAMGKARPGTLELAETTALPPETKSTATISEGSVSPTPVTPAALAPEEPRHPLPEAAPSPSRPIRPTPAARPQMSVPARPLPPPGWAVQIGAFETLQAAKSHWPTMKKSSAGTQPDQEAPNSAIFRFNFNGRELYRLAMVGFDDWSQAEAACLTIKNSGQTCLVKRAGILGDPIWLDRSVKTK